MEEEGLTLNEREIAEYIQEQLIKEGYATTIEFIEMILILELEYMVIRGIAERYEEEE